MGVLTSTMLLSVPSAPRVVILASLGLAVSVLTWILAGGREATAGGILALGAALFAYFPALYYLNSGVYNPLLPTATTLVLAVQLATTLLLAGRSREAQPIEPRRDLPLQDIRRCFTLGILLVAAGAGISLAFELGSTSLPAAVAFVGSVLIMYGSIYAGDKLRLRSLVLSGAAVAVYMVLLFTTGGRLVIGVLVFVGIVLAVQRVRKRSLKVLVIIGLVPALFGAALQRSTVIQSTRGVRETGLESVVFPIDRLATLLGMAEGGSLTPAWGHTFIPSLFFWVPRRLWLDKPPGFGAELVPVLRPELIGTGHSEAATVVGEWLWNFGLAGLVLLPLVGALLLLLIGRWRHSLAQPNPRRGTVRLYSHVAFALVAGGMLDLFWVGTFGFAERTGMRLLALVIVVLIATSLPRWGRSGRQAPRRPRSPRVMGVPAVTPIPPR